MTRKHRDYTSMMISIVTKYLGTQKQLDDTSFERADDTEQDIYRILKEKSMQSDQELVNYIRKRVTMQDPNVDEVKKEISGQNHTFFKML